MFGHKFYQDHVLEILDVIYALNLMRSILSFLVEKLKSEIFKHENAWEIL